MAREGVGIPVQALDEIERDYLRWTLRDLPSSPMLPEDILAAIPRKHLDIPYGPERRQKIDLYLPPEAEKGHVPLFVHIHGGGWMAGDKRDMQVSIYFGLLNHGYAVAGVGYRLSDAAQFPKPVHDCKAAIRYLKAHALEYGIDPARVAVGGGSAGGHLALLIATTPNVPYLEDLSMGNAAYGTDVRCAVATYPPTDLALLGMEDPDTPENLFMGGIIPNMDPTFVDMASPRHFVTRQVPPLFVQAGSDDEIVPHEQSILFAQTVREVAGEGRIRFKIVKGAGHADPAFKEPSYLAQVIDFLDGYLK